MRGFAVLLVFCVHYVSLMAPWIDGSPVYAFARTLENLGSTGVDLFFVLSGYLIYGSLIARRQPFLSFMARRLQRIYPAFTVVFLIYVGLSLLFPAENKIPSPTGAGALYLLQNYLLLPGLFPIRAMITVAWSLSYEMFYYLLIPLLIALLKLRERSSSWRVTLFLVVTVTFSVYTSVNGGPVELLMFVTGILLYETIANSTWRVSSLAGFMALVLGLTGALAISPGWVGDALQNAILSVAFFTLCLACFRSPQGWLPRAFSWTPLRWLGNMSYSYYLLHGLTLRAALLALGKVVPPTGEQGALFWLWLPPLLALTLIPAAALFLLIERPFSLAPRKTRGASKLPSQAASASESGS